MTRREAWRAQEALRTDAYIYALLNFVFPFLGGLLLVHANRLAVLAQVKITAALIAELFRKATRMSIECAPHACALLVPSTPVEPSRQSAAEASLGAAADRPTKAHDHMVLLCAAGPSCTFCDIPNSVRAPWPCVVTGRAQQSIEKGKIINLMSADIENVNTFIHPAMGGLLVLPLTIIVAIVLLYQQIGCALEFATCAACVFRLFHVKPLASVMAITYCVG